MEKSYDFRVVQKSMPLQLLSDITNKFSEEQKLGNGTFGIVYKGVYNGEEIAVKMLHNMPGELNHQQSFVNEFENLARLTHPNIVKLIGYCYEVRNEVIDLNGKFVVAENVVHRALCFEYMHQGSLEKHLDEEHCGLDWPTRYKIIKGTCEGLKYLHEGMENPVCHLDLKPENILLDMSMVPKLADFGLSKLVPDGKTNATQSPLGTRGYVPPEYIDGNLFSIKFDIYSLGVIMIKIITGHKGYSEIANHMPPANFVDQVQQNWKNRLQTVLKDTQLNAECNQVKRCVEIALQCIEPNRDKRPRIGKIVDMLNETEAMIIERMAICSPPTNDDPRSNGNKACGSLSESMDAVMSMPLSPLSGSQHISNVPTGTGYPSKKVISVTPSSQEMNNTASMGTGYLSKKVISITPPSQEMHNTAAMETGYPSKKVTSVTPSSMGTGYPSKKVTSVTPPSMGTGYPIKKVTSVTPPSMGTGYPIKKGTSVTPPSMGTGYPNKKVTSVTPPSMGTGYPIKKGTSVTPPSTGTGYPSKKVTSITPPSMGTGYPIKKIHGNWKDKEQQGSGGSSRKS